MSPGPSPGTPPHPHPAPGLWQEAAVPLARRLEFLGRPADSSEPARPAHSWAFQETDPLPLQAPRALSQGTLPPGGPPTGQAPVAPPYDQAPPRARAGACTRGGGGHRHRCGTLHVGFTVPEAPGSSPRALVTTSWGAVRRAGPSLGCSRPEQRASDGAAGVTCRRVYSYLFGGGAGPGHPSSGAVTGCQGPFLSQTPESPGQGRPRGLR